MARIVPSALLWCDIETPGLPEGNDFSTSPILEIAGVITDFDLTKFTGVHEAVKLTKEHVEILKKNPEVVKMHKSSGLLEECKNSTKTLKDLEESMLDLVKQGTFEKGEYILAGSGVASFDYPLIKHYMPELASWLTYYTLDIGILRRSVYYLSHRRNFVDDTKNSYKDGYKKHRAMDDVLAHIEEAEKYRDWLRGLPSLDS